MSAYGYHPGHKIDSSAPSSTPEQWRKQSTDRGVLKPGWTSVSALDIRNADAIRRDAFTSIYTSSPATFPVPDSSAAGQRTEAQLGQTNNTDKSMSSPPRLRKPRRSHSTEVAIRTSYQRPAPPTGRLGLANPHALPNNYQQAQLLRVPARLTAPKTSINMAVSAQYQAYHPSLGAVPSPSLAPKVLRTKASQQDYHRGHGQQYHNVEMQLQTQSQPNLQSLSLQSTADFVMRTDRSAARAKQNQLINNLAKSDPPSAPVNNTALHSTPHARGSRRVSTGSTLARSSAAAASANRQSFDSHRSVSLGQHASFGSGTAPSPSTGPSTSRVARMSSPLPSRHVDGNLQNGLPVPAHRRMSWGGNQQGHGAPWQLTQHVKRRQPRKPGELFAALPGEVLELIMEALKKSHLAPESKSCATCWMRDACSVAVSCRKWNKFARAALYEDIQLVGAESPVWKKRYKLADGARLVLLRRTLRSNPRVAAIVRSLKPPAQPQGLAVDEYHNLIASVVMACPNLERLIGFYPSYNQTFSRLFHALSTRQRLKEMNWTVEPAAVPRYKFSGSSSNVSGVLQKKSGISYPIDGPSENGMSGLVEHHANWLYLNTLSIHCLPGATLSPEDVLPSIFKCLPALKHLNLSCFPASAFNDQTLQVLPPLKSLSLSYLPGITSNGLSAFASRSAAQGITKLTIRHIELSSLPTLARILGNLQKLHTLNIIQYLPPCLPNNEVIWLFPYLASASLHTLHWDMTSSSPTSPATKPDTILARSIAANGFPGLRVLRVPNDGDGIFQSLCRPRDKIDLPTDKYRFPASGLGLGNHTKRPSISSEGSGRPGTSSGSSRPSMSSSGSSSSLKKSASSVPTSPIEAFKRASDLVECRLAAQQRLERGRRMPRVFVNVVDEGEVVEKYGLGGYIGTVGSKIQYHLLPDPGASDKGGLVEVTEMLGPCGEQVGMGDGGIGDGTGMLTEGCTGKWNTWHEMAATDKKEKERRWHVERGRWRGVAIS